MANQTYEQRLPEWLDAYMPFRGPCAFCGGPDARHRVVDSICENVRAGDDVPGVAANYDVSEELVLRLLAMDNEV